MLGIPATLPPLLCAHAAAAPGAGGVQIDKKETTRAPSMPDLPDVDHTGAGGAGGAGSSSSPHSGRAMPQKALEGVELVQDLENHNPRSGFEQPGRLTPEQVELVSNPNPRLLSP